MDELTAFVTARLDEDEAAAHAGARRVGMPWHAEPQPGTPGGLVIDELGLVGSTGGRYAAEHIARHDPARVLREVATKRAILTEHSPHWPVYFPQPSGQPMCCVCDEGGFDPDPVDWPCPAVRALAVVWNDHPDYPSSGGSDAL